MVNEFRDRVAIYEHERLVFAGVAGTMERKLEDVGSELHKRFSNIEIAPLQPQRGRDFLPIMEFETPLDITLDQYNPVENSIVIYGLNKPRILETMEEISSLGGFVPHNPQSHDVRQTWQKELEIEKRTYEMCEQIASALHQPLEKVFGLVRYTNFLMQYLYMGGKDAQRLASKKFGISLIV